MSSGISGIASGSACPAQRAPRPPGCPRVSPGVPRLLFGKSGMELGLVVATREHKRLLFPGPSLGMAVLGRREKQSGAGAGTSELQGRCCSSILDFSEDPKLLPAFPQTPLPAGCSSFTPDSRCSGRVWRILFGAQNPAVLPGSRVGSAGRARAGLAKAFLGFGSWDFPLGEE